MHKFPYCFNFFSVIFSGGATFTIRGQGFNNVGEITVDRVVSKYQHYDHQHCIILFYIQSTCQKVRGLASCKTRFHYYFLHKKMPVSHQEYDICYPFVDMFELLPFN